MFRNNLPKESIISARFWDPFSFDEIIRCHNQLQHFFAEISHEPGKIFIRPELLVSPSRAAS